MNELRDRKIRFGDVADALGIKRNTLRNWFDRNGIRLISERPTAGWAEFTLSDVAVLAVMNQLVRWGLTVEQAAEVGHSLIDEPTQHLLQYKSTPAGVLLAHFSGRMVIIYRAAGGDQVEAYRSNKEAVNFLFDRWLAAALDLLAVPQARQSILVLDPRSAIADAFVSLGVVELEGTVDIDGEEA